MAMHIVILWTLLGSRLNQSLKHWTKPTTASLAVGTLADLTRSRRICSPKTHCYASS
jgi:hypothetical protein